ncbi:MAG: N-acetyltransferase [Spirochaetales bacterium]|nr:N-acetyltransferase [Spirochaetales bacterium]
MIIIRRPTVDDVNSIFRLTNKMAEKGLMLSRSKYKIITMLNGFLVAEDSETKQVIGCGAFSLLWTDMGEVMALAVDDAYQKKGVGKMLVNALLDEGRRLNVPEVITLTYQVEFFKKLGFALADKDKFPRKMWRECLECPKLEQCDEIALHIFLNNEKS